MEFLYSYFPSPGKKGNFTLLAYFHSEQNPRYDGLHVYHAKVWIGCGFNNRNKGVLVWRIYEAIANRITNFDLLFRSRHARARLCSRLGRKA